MSQVGLRANGVLEVWANSVPSSIIAINIIPSNYSLESYCIHIIHYLNNSSIVQFGSKNIFQKKCRLDTYLGPISIFFPYNISFVDSLHIHSLLEESRETSCSKLYE